MHRIIFIFICGLCGSCTRHTSESSRAAALAHTDLSPLDEKKVIEIARTTLSTNADFRADKVSYSVWRDGSNWWVTVWREPKAPGGFCDVEVTHDGKVKAIRPGL